MNDTHSDIMAHMSAYIHTRRHDLGLSLEDVAKKAGSTKAHIWALEHGKSSNPTLGLILALCDALQCDMTTLMASPVSLPTGQMILALEKSVDFIESLTADPLLLPDDIEMTLDDVQRHARIELASIRNLMARPAVSDGRKFDTARNVTEEEIRQWASTRADDAGYLAREMVALWTALTNTSGDDEAPVAWQHRVMDAGFENWSEWRDGKSNLSASSPILFEERPLFARPQSAGNNEPTALIECLERHVEEIGHTEIGQDIQAAIDVLRHLSAVARPQSAAVRDGWQPIKTAPKGEVTEDAGCRGASEWFLGRVAPKYAAFRPPYIVIRRRAWPQEDSWSCAGEADYVPAFFDAWAPISAALSSEGTNGHR